ncbi:MAG: Mpo1-like protein [Colwellia sp.]
MTKEYKSFDTFYPFYLSQHQDKTCRRLHFIGSFFIVLLTIYSVITSQYKLLFFIPLIGYGFAWVGHFIFERNRPATFTYPIYSLIGDWVMFKDILIGKIKF